MIKGFSQHLFSILAPWSLFNSWEQISFFLFVFWGGGVGGSVCCHPVRPLPLQPQPADIVWGPAPYTAGLQRGGGAGVSGSLDFSPVIISLHLPKTCKRIKKKICSILHVILCRFKLHTITICMYNKNSFCWSCEFNKNKPWCSDNLIIASLAHTCARILYI